MINLTFKSMIKLIALKVIRITINKPSQQKKQLKLNNQLFKLVEHAINFMGHKLNLTNALGVKTTDI